MSSNLAEFVPSALCLLSPLAAAWLVLGLVYLVYRFSHKKPAGSIRGWEADNITTDEAARLFASSEFKALPASERASIYRATGKSPSGVVDGVYNDFNRTNEEYNDMDRDWDADA